MYIFSDAIHHQLLVISFYLFRLRFFLFPHDLFHVHSQLFRKKLLLEKREASHNNIKYLFDSKRIILSLSHLLWLLECCLYIPYRSWNRSEVFSKLAHGWMKTVMKVIISSKQKKTEWKRKFRFLHDFGNLQRWVVTQTKTERRGNWKKFLNIKFGSLKELHISILQQTEKNIYFEVFRFKATHFGPIKCNYQDSTAHHHLQISQYHHILECICFQSLLKPISNQNVSIFWNENQQFRHLIIW